MPDRLRLYLDQMIQSHVCDVLITAGYDVVRVSECGQSRYIQVYTQPNYQNLGFKIGHCPEAEKYYQEAITLPLFPTMSEEDQDRVVEALKETLSTEYTE